MLYRVHPIYSDFHQLRTSAPPVDDSAESDNQDSLTDEEVKPRQTRGDTRERTTPVCSFVLCLAATNTNPHQAHSSPANEDDGYDDEEDSNSQSMHDGAVDGSPDAIGNLKVNIFLFVFNIHIDSKTCCRHLVAAILTVLLPLQGKY